MESVPLKDKIESIRVKRDEMRKELAELDAAIAGLAGSDPRGLVAKYLPSLTKYLGTALAGGGSLALLADEGAFGGLLKGLAQAFVGG